VPESVFSRFENALREEGIAERRAEREATKLEPLVITIADQQELRALHELAKRFKRDTPTAMVRRHLRGWCREQLAAVRIEQKIA